MCGVDCQCCFKGSSSRVIKDHLKWSAFFSYKLLQGWMFMLNMAKVSNNDFIKKHRSQKERVGISVNWTVLVTYKNKTVELEVRMINCKLII